MNHITSHVTQILQNCDKEHYWKFLLMSKWQQIMGNLACKVFILKIQKKTIVLGVSDSCWMQELNLLSELLKEKINTILGANHIETIKLRYSIGNKKNVQKKDNSISLPTVSKKLTKQELEALERIQDQELAQALLGFLQKCHQFS